MMSTMAIVPVWKISGANYPVGQINSGGDMPTIHEWHYIKGEKLCPSFEFNIFDANGTCFAIHRDAYLCPCARIIKMHRSSEIVEFDWGYLVDWQFDE